MECKRCGCEINNGEIICKVCTEEIERESRESRVSRNQYKLVKDETVEMVPTREEKLNQEIEKETEAKEEKNKKKKKLIIIASSIAGGLLLIGIILFLIFGNKNKKDEEEQLDYNAIMKSYAEEVERVVLLYHNGHGTLPSDEWILDEIDFDYDVDCEQIELLHPNMVRLVECRVEKSEETFSKEIIIKDISADVLIVCYAPIDPNAWVSNTMPGLCPPGNFKEYEIECVTDQCNIIEAFAEYVAILERNGHIRVYNFVKEEVVYQSETSVNIRFIVYENKLLGFSLTNSSNQMAIYNRSSSHLVVPFGRLKFSEFMMYVVRGVNNYVLIFDSGGDFGGLNLSTGTVIIPVEYEAIFRHEQMENRYLIGVKNSKMFLLETDTGTILLNGRSYDVVSPTSNLNGHALVIDGNNLRLLTMSGEEVISQKLEGDGVFFDAGVSNNLMRVYIKVFEGDDCVEYAYDFRIAAFQRTASQTCLHNTM